MNKLEYKILIVEDNDSMRNGIVSAIRKKNYSVDSSSNGKLGWEKIQKQNYNLVITDIKMPGMNGLDLFRNIKQKYPSIDVILITAYATVDIAVDAMKLGADDFITKPFSISELREKIRLCFERKISQQELSESFTTDNDLIGETECINKIKLMIEKTARTDSPVLISGESGTGKELIAQLVHSNSKRKNNKFLAINCGAISENLLESELFGHEKGSFTGAIKTHIGKFEQCNNGTLLLDEIGEMPLSLQVKLLRVLQSKTFHRVGGEKEITSNFRLIASTNRKLEDEVTKGTFRADLYYRLNVIPITAPPLRQRKEDIPLLVNYILRKKSGDLKRNIPKIQASVMRKLKSYSWPGNVRELENFLERALVFIEEDTFTDELFNFANIGNESSEESNWVPHGDLVITLEKIEREMIVNALTETRGVKQQAANLLNIKPGALYYKMEKYEIDENEY